MMTVIGEVEDDIIHGNICWMVSDNMKELLAINKQPNVTTKSVEDPGFLTVLQDQLMLNRLVILGQDLDDADHWFVCIRDKQDVHIIEHLVRNAKNNHVETMKLNKFMKLMRKIMSGEVPDRFYKKKSLHQFLLLSYDRKPMSRQVVLDYINQ